MTEPMEPAGFDDWQHAEKIRFFAWQLHSTAAKPRFTTGDMRGCFERLNLSQPGNLSQQLAQLVQQKQLLKDGQGYALEKRVRDSFEEQFGQRPSTVNVTKLLLELPSKVPDPLAREFLDEALRCFRAQAFRAAMVMTWNLAFDHLRAWVLNGRVDAFNRQWPLRFPKHWEKARVQVIATADDFGELKESEMIDVCLSAGLIPVDVAKILRDKLEKRNTAAHPSKIFISQLQAEAFIDDLINNVVLKLR
jgi:hypothetical protein